MVTTLERLTFWRRMALVLFVVACMAVVGGMEAQDREIEAQMRAEAEERALAQDWAWYRRHERHRAACPLQQYVSQCCTAGRNDLACIEGHITKERK